VLRRVLPSNLVNEKALAHWGGCRAKNKHYCGNDDLPIAASVLTMFIRKWERLFVSGFKFNSPVSTATALLNSSQKGNK